MSNPTVLFTGGATGADLYFATQGLRASHLVRVMSFEGHKQSLPKTSSPNLRLERMTSDTLKAANKPLARAAEKLQRKLERTGYVERLLQRNYFQTKDVDSVYAVGEILPKGRKDSVRVSGGTAWACQMFLDRLIPLGDAKEPRMIPIFVFSQSQKHWLQCQLEGSFVEWVKIEAPPKPAGKYAGIGTRFLSEAGKAAIDSLFQ